MWCDAFRKPPCVSRESFSNLRMTRLFRGDRAKPVKDTTQSFLPPSRRGRRKEIDVFRSLPFTHFLLASAVRREPYDRGRVYARTSNQTRTGYRRLYTGRHQRRRVFVPRTFRLPAVMNFTYTRFITPVDGCRNNGACYSRATSDEGSRRSSSISSMYFDATLVRHHYLCTRRGVS